MKLSTSLLSICVLLLTTSCSIFNSLHKKAKVQQEMVKQLETTPYQFSLKELQNKVVEYVENPSLDGKWTFTSQAGLQNQDKMNKVNEAMREGFIYKQQFYTATLNLDFTSPSSIENLKNVMFKGQYHTLDNTDTGFIIVQGNTIFEAKKFDANQSYLKVYRLTDVVRPLGVNLDWWNMLRGKGLFATIEQQPVDFQSSRKYQIQDQSQEISFFFHVDKARAEKLESDLMEKENET